MKFVSLVIAIVGPMILSGIWLGSLQSKANTTEALLIEHKETSKDLEREIKEYMKKSDHSLTLIKYKLKIKDE